MYYLPTYLLLGLDVSLNVLTSGCGNEFSVVNLVSHQVFLRFLIESPQSHPKNCQGKVSSHVKYSKKNSPSVSLDLL